MEGDTASTRGVAPNPEQRGPNFGRGIFKGGKICVKMCCELPPPLLRISESLFAHVQPMCHPGGGGGEHGVCIS